MISQANKTITEDLRKMPPADKKQAKMYGEEYKKIRREQRDKIKKNAVSKEINKAFEKEIGGGTHNNPYAPPSANKVNEKTVRNTLDRIRGIRKRTVQRNYSQNRKK